MGYTSTPNSYQKMQELSMIPYPQQLAIAVPEIRFYKDVHGLLALCPFHNDKSVGSFVFNPKTGVNALAMADAILSLLNSTTEPFLFLIFMDLPPRNLMQPAVCMAVCPISCIS